MNYKIWLTGTHSTGKTTLVDYFLNLNPNYHKAKSRRRELLEQGIIKVNREAAPFDEIFIGGDVMESILSTPAPSISDRSWVCKCAYAQLLPYPDEVLEAMHIYYTYAFPGFSERDIYVYVPPTIPIIGDGVRDIDEDYRQQVDNMIQFYLDFFEIPHIVLTTIAIQDRYLQIMDYIKMKEEIGE